MQFVWVFLKIFKYCLLQGNLRKAMKKTFLKKQQFSVEILARFKVFTLFKGFFTDLC